MAGVGWPVSGVPTHPCLRRFPEALEEEGGLPSVSVAGGGTGVQKGLFYPSKCPGLQEAREMETRQGCVRRRECRLLSVQLPEPHGGSGQGAETGGFDCSSHKPSQATRPESYPWQASAWGPSGQRLSGRPCAGWGLSRSLGLSVKPPGNTYLRMCPCPSPGSHWVTIWGLLNCRG